MRRPSPWNFYWLAALLLAGCFPAGAQPAASTNGATSYAPVHLNPVLYLPPQQQRVQGKKFVDQYAAPPILFREPQAPEQLMDPAMLQQRSPEELRRQKHQEDLQKNWMLLTPEEILGVKDDKKNADDPDQNLSAEQRFVKRLEMARINTNSAADKNSLLDNGNWRQNNGLDSQIHDASSFFRSSQSSFSRVSGFQDTTANNNNNNDGFNPPAQLTKPSPWASAWSPPMDLNNTYNNSKAEAAHLAAIERFRQILSPVEAAPVKPLNAGGQPAGFRNESLYATPSVGKPLGSGFVPLKDNIGRPAPLPSLYALPKTTPAVDNSRHPAPPPWTVNRIPANF